MKKYKRNIGTFIWSSIATSVLGALLLIPILNNFILNFIIRAETGINTRYYYRKDGQKNIFAVSLEGGSK